MEEGAWNIRSLIPERSKGWRISQGIAFAVLALTAAAGDCDHLPHPMGSLAALAGHGGAVIAAAPRAWPACVLPQIEYRQWGYIIEEDKVVIRHGIFFVTKSIVPIIRIQNITISQGPINRRLGLYKLELSLASGSFEIVGLNRETAEFIGENLKQRLYARVREKGVLQ